MEETRPVYFVDIFLFLFMFLMFGCLVSLFPEDHVVQWLIFNCILAVLATFVIMIIWIFQKNNSKRYYSLLSFVMLWVLTYYLMSPAFKILYPTKFFWILLSFTLGYTIFLLLNRVQISIGILNPGVVWLKKLLLIYLLIFSCLVIGLFVYVSLIHSYSVDMIAVGTILYLCGFLFLSLSPVLLTKPEVAKQLEKMPNN